MSYQITKHLEDRYIVVEHGEDYDVQTEVQNVIGDTIAIFNSVEKPIFVILDFSKAKLNFQDVLVGGNAAARGEDSPFSHPKVRQTLFVTNNRALKMSADGFKNEVFGSHNIPVFESVEQAVSYVLSRQWANT
ncbi:MAG: hypothetical protein KC708_08005 [Anaerolineae bacterium]|nr:hypothetical protein [Anaerolineae bacterium]